jgi:hypothetical protein
MKYLLFIFLLITEVFSLSGQPVISKPPVAINKVYVGLQASLLVNFISFADDRFVDNRLRITPLFSRAIGFSFRQNILKRFSLQTGASAINIGYTAKFTSNYRGGSRYSHTSSGSNYFNMFQIPIEIIYLMRTQKESMRKYVSMGANLLFNPNSDAKGIVSTSGTYMDSFNGDLFKSTEYRYPSPRLTPTLQFGVGIEKDVSHWGLLSVGIIYNQGLKSIARWDLKYKTWDISEDIDAIAFENSLNNEGTYLGLKVGFKVSPSLFSKR